MLNIIVLGSKHCYNIFSLANLVIALGIYDTISFKYHRDVIPHPTPHSLSHQVFFQHAICIV